MSDIIIVAVKYQILTKDKTFFAEVELPEKISNEKKLEIIGNMENNVIKIHKSFTTSENYQYTMKNYGDQLKSGKFSFDE